MANKNLPSTSSWREYAELGSTPQVSNQKYQELFDNNPYRKMTYNKSAWQDFWESLGFRTKYDTWNEQNQENAYQYDAGIYQQMFQDAYNSETAKAERMRQAGENPDLLGTGNVSEASSPFQDPAGMDASAFVDEQSVPGQIASGVFSAFSTAIGVASQFLQLQGLQNEVTGKGIANAEGMMNLINQRVLGLTPAEGFKDDSSFKQWKQDVITSLRNAYGTAFFRNRRANHQWQRSIDDFIGGLPQSRDQYDAWKTRLGTAKDYLTGREDHWSESLEMFKELNHNIIDMQNAITENKKSAELTQSEADIERAGYELEYQQGRDAGLASEAENAENRRRKEGDTFEGILNKHLAKIANTLDKYSNQGGFVGWVAEIVLYIMASRGITFSAGSGKDNVSGTLQLPQAR